MSREPKIAISERPAAPRRAERAKFSGLSAFYSRVGTDPTKKPTWSEMVGKILGPTKPTWDFFYRFGRLVGLVGGWSVFGRFWLVFAYLLVGLVGFWSV